MNKIGNYPQRSYALPSELFTEWDCHEEEKVLRYFEKEFTGANLYERMRAYAEFFKEEIKKYSPLAKAYEESMWKLCIDSFLQLKLY